MAGDIENTEIIVEEKYGQFFQRYYCRDRNAIKIKENSKRSVSFTSLANFFTVVFLPHGYPATVSEDYLQYQLWDSIQAFASSITGSLATHAILKGAGVGDKDATTLGATLTWILKDGTSMVGRIAFTWLHGTKLDTDCKKWRLFADVLNDVALLLDLISAHFKGYFLPIMCLSGVFKSVVSVAGGATRAALTQHQARQNNMADVSAKDGSQETLVNLAALICSLIILPIVAENNTFIWLLYIYMTLIHLTANYWAVKSVKMETFNQDRFMLFMNEYIKSERHAFPSVTHINKKENVFFFKSTFPVHLGTSFQEATHGKSDAEIRSLIKLYEKSQYFLTYRRHKSNECIYICLRQIDFVEAQLQAMYQACLIKHMLNSQRFREGHLWDLYNKTMIDKSLEEFTLKYTRQHFSNFLKNTRRSGWKIDIAMFNVDLWNVKW